MSAIVCGKRSPFDDLHMPPAMSKRSRYVGPNSNPNSPIYFPTTSPTRISTADTWMGSHRHLGSVTEDNLSRLRGLFPGIDEQILEQAWVSCGKDLDSTIKCLNEHQLGPSQTNSTSCRNTTGSRFGLQLQKSFDANAGGNFAAKSFRGSNQSETAISVPTNGSEWVELFLREMMSASDLDDARVRASIALEALENIVVARTGAIAENLQKENSMLKERVQGLFRDSNILKRAVAIQHDRQWEHEETGHEMQRLKQLLSQSQEQLRTLEMNNYVLSMHLHNAWESTCIPGCFHPDVF